MKQREEEESWLGLGIPQFVHLLPFDCYCLHLFLSLSLISSGKKKEEKIKIKYLFFRAIDSCLCFLLEGANIAGEQKRVPLIQPRPISIKLKL